MRMADDTGQSGSPGYISPPLTFAQVHTAEPAPSDAALQLNAAKVSRLADHRARSAAGQPSRYDGPVSSMHRGPSRRSVAVR